MYFRHGLLIALALSALSSSGGTTAGPTPALKYDSPSGFSRGDGNGETWIADGLDGVIQVYPFRRFHGDFAGEFRRTLFRDWISAPYREDQRLDQPNVRRLSVKGAEAAMAASFKNYNGGAPRDHLRVAVLVSGRVALLDISANSPAAFERNRPAFSGMLNSLRVVESGPDP
jgi:hypothetical protein